MPPPSRPLVAVAASAPAPGPAGSGGMRLWQPVIYQVAEASQALLWGNWHIIRDRHLASNALVMVEGGSAPSHSRNLMVNGAYRPLGVRAWLVVCVLAAHRIASGGGPVPFFVPNSHFISADEIVFLVNGTLLPEIRRDFGNPAFWTAPGPDDVHNEVYDLRNQLGKSGVNPNLVETSRQGFRFSLPPPNIALVCWEPVVSPAPPNAPGGSAAC